MAKVIATAEALPDSPELQSLTRLVQELLDLRKEREEIEDSVKVMKKREALLEEELLPALLHTLNLSELKTDEGHKVTLVDEIQCSVADKNKPIVIEWLSEINSMDLVKTLLSMTFPRDEFKRADDLVTALEAAGYSVDRKLDIHSGTFKAFLRERLGNGDPIPWDRLSARSFEKVKIK